MKKLVILGAGFSVPAGLPTMSGFRTAIADVLEASGGHQASEEVNPIPDRDILRAVEAEWGQRTSEKLCEAHDLESFCVSVDIDRATHHRGDGRWPVPDPWDLYASVRYAVARVCDLKLTSGPTRTSSGVWEKLYLRFAREVTAAADVCVLSLNYDLLLDQALIQQRIFPDYRLERVREVNAHCERHKPTGPEKLTLLKPHGSFNWFVCRKQDCKLISLKWEYGPWEGVLRARPGNWPTGREKHHRLEHRLNDEDALEFLLVPPQKNKERERANFPEVWQACESAVEEATQVFFLGWSAPDTDKHIRELLRSRLDRGVKAWVVNSDDGEAIRQRYRDSLPTGVAPEFALVRFGPGETDGTSMGLDGPWWNALRESGRSHDA